MKGKFTSLMAVVGLVVSLICGFIVGNRIVHILMVSLFSSVAMALVGIGVYSILEKKVPEFIEFLEGISLKGGFGMSFGGNSEGVDLDEENSEFKPERSADLEEGGGGNTNTPNIKDNSKFGDHIMIDNIAIKNEPKLMAEAIRTFLSMDEPTAPQK